LLLGFSQHLSLALLPRSPTFPYNLRSRRRIIDPINLVLPGSDYGDKQPTAPPTPPPNATANALANLVKRLAGISVRLANVDGIWAH